MHQRAHRGARGAAKKLTALLDAQAGVQYEGEAAPQGSHDDYLAIRAWNLLADGNGGVHWQGLELVAGWLGITDLEGLMTRLEIIKGHRPNESD